MLEQGIVSDNMTPEGRSILAEEAKRRRGLGAGVDTWLPLVDLALAGLRATQKEIIGVPLAIRLSESTKTLDENGNTESNPVEDDAKRATTIKGFPESGPINIAELVRNRKPGRKQPTPRPYAS